MERVITKERLEKELARAEQDGALPPVDLPHNEGSLTGYLAGIQWAIDHTGE